MEVNQALEDLFASDEFRQQAKSKDKEGGRLRMFVSRFRRGEVSTGNAVELLANFGYSIEVKNNNNENLSHE